MAMTILQVTSALNAWGQEIPPTPPEAHVDSLVILGNKITATCKTNQANVEGAFGVIRDHSFIPPRLVGKAEDADPNPPIQNQAFTNEFVEPGAGWNLNTPYSFRLQVDNGANPPNPHHWEGIVSFIIVLDNFGQRKIVFPGAGGPGGED
ncbi:MAG TPA: hypothetical protein PKD54_14560 [Pirellulaceae bacterium]|nr:hypothetical protein [Pirellulaceae bacterium]